MSDEINVTADTAKTVAPPPPDKTAELVASMTKFKGPPVAAIVANLNPEQKPVEIPKQNGVHKPEVPDAKLKEAPKEKPDDLDLSGGVDGVNAPKVEAVVEPVQNNGGPKALREELARVKRELEETRSKVSSNPEELKAIQAEAKKIREERDELANTVAEVDFRRSPKYQSEFIAPWKQAMDTAVKEIGEFTKEEDGKTVAVTWEDFKPLLSMKTPVAIAKAKELFGDAFGMAMDHRRTLLKLEENATKAIDQHKQIEQTDLAERVQENTRLKETYENEISRLGKEFPHLYPEPDSKDENQVNASAKSQQLATAALFGWDGLDPAVRHKAAAVVMKRVTAYPLMAIQKQKAEERVAELEKEVAKLRGNGPGPGTTVPRSGGDMGVTKLNIAEDMKAFVAKSRRQ